MIELRNPTTVEPSCERIHISQVGEEGVPPDLPRLQRQRLSDCFDRSQSELGKSGETSGVQYDDVFERSKQLNGTQ